MGPDQIGWQAELVSLAAELKIERQVVWAGPRMGENKWGALAVAEVFVLPSHQENFGIAVVEALACRVPVLISDKVNIWREILGENAGLVATDSVEGTEQMLRAWAELSAKERETYATHAEACFQKHFDIRVCAEAVLEAVRTAGSKTAAGPVAASRT